MPSCHSRPSESLTTKSIFGPPERWNEAEAAIERVARRMNLPGCEPEPGEAAFYGPKIDFVVNDSLGREWQLGTVPNSASRSGSSL